MYDLWGGRNPNSYCSFCGQLAPTSIYFGNQPWCGGNQCIIVYLYKVGQRRASTGRKRIDIENKYRGGINGSQDETERIYNKKYRFMPKFRDMMIEKHRKRKAEQYIELGKQRRLTPDEVKRVNEVNEEADKQLYAKAEITKESSTS